MYWAQRKWVGLCRCVEGSYKMARTWALKKMVGLYSHVEGSFKVGVIVSHVLGWVLRCKLADIYWAVGEVGDSLL